MIRSGPRITIVLAAAFAASIMAAAFAQLNSTQMRMISELRAPAIVIRKSARVLEVYDGPELVRTYNAALGFSPDKDKEVEGDGRTPEGEFYVFTKNPKSRFHLSLGLSYPARDDGERGFARGLISESERAEIVKAIELKGMPPQKTRLGGEIYIHGGGAADDWTDGCIAIDNDEMTELFKAIPVGARVTILK